MTMPFSAGPARGRTKNPIPASAGVGLKPQHGREILETPHGIGFFEFHAENYMCAGGPPHRLLSVVRERFFLSMHGVGLSIGGEGPLDREHLQRLADLNECYRPELFSEHLAWSSHGGTFFNDLLPLPYNAATLQRVAAHIDEVQAFLNRRMLLENPSSYVTFSESTWSETEFLAELVRRTGCGLLLDVNNVHVSAVNQGFEALSYLEAFPLDAVGEVHLAGHATETEAGGGRVLIDAHDRAVADPVWALYEVVLSRTGPVPTLIEWDNDVPAFPVLAAEAVRAAALLQVHGAGASDAYRAAAGT
ncbi:hypothetical protein GGD81_001943 [Rhodobium orientis]|nr:hypothetical protein [Rhodobium orientis]